MAGERDEVYVRFANGATAGPIPASWQGESLIVPSIDQEIGVGDVVLRRPAGRSTETFLIIDTVFRSGLLDIPDTWQLTVRREKRLDLRAGVASGTLMENAHRVPVGRLTLADLHIAFDALLAEIEASAATPFQKQEARARVFRLLSHRTLAETIGKKAKAVRRLLAASHSDANSPSIEGDSHVPGLPARS